MDATDIAAVALAGSIDDGDDAEVGGESDLEQMESTELAGDVSSSSRDATPQQDDTDISTMNIVPQVENKEQEAFVTPEPQVALALKIAHTLVSVEYSLLKRIVYEKISL